MKRVLLVAGVLAAMVLALLIVACGSDPEPSTSAAPPTPTADASGPEATTHPPTPAPTAASVEPTPQPTVAPTPEPAGEAADPSDAYFALDRVLEVSIEIAGEDWDTLRHQTRTFDDLMAEIERYNLSRPFADIYDWFPATVTIDGETHAEVGVRKKGFLGSQSDTKPSLKLRYDKYVDGQSLGGVMQRMTLNNSIQDPSMINTCLSYQVFAAAGLPSPRCNFATVTVNGNNLGLYIHLEEIKEPFLARHFDSAEGNLYEGTISDFDPVYRGTMEKKTNEDADDWSDVDAVMSALQDSSPEGLQALGEIVDLDRFLSFWAAEVLVGHWDGYAGDRNNYHFYREPDGKFVFIPWGVDDTFHLKVDPNPFDNISNPPPSVLALTAIPNRLYNTPEWRTKYVQRLKEILDTVWNESELLASVDEMAAIVRQHALTEDRDAAAEDTDRIRKFILTRKGGILADLTPEPPDWPEPDFGESAGELDLEPFEIRFETTWGTSQSANPLAEGTVYELTGDGEWVAGTSGEVGAIAGPASPQEQSDIGVEDAALFTVMGRYPDGAIRGVTFWMPLDRISDGAELSIGVDAGVGAAVWTIPAGGAEPQDFIPITDGHIELTVAGTEPGAAIAGTFLAAGFGFPAQPPGDVREPPDGLPEEWTGTEQMELHFETSWGSKEDPATHGEGYVLYLDSEFVETFDYPRVVIGWATDDERAILPGLADLVSINLYGFSEDGALRGFTLVLPLEQFAAETTLVIGEDAIGGGLWRIPAGAGAPDVFIPFTSGRLELELAGTEPGDLVWGKFYVTGDAPGSGETATLGTVNAEGVMDIGLVINEVAAKGDPMDWFELHNRQAGPIGLFALLVADDLDDAGKRVAFPADAMIYPGEYLQFEVDSDNWAGFRLGGDEELGIWLADGTLVAMVDWDEGDSGEGQSYARLPDGSGEFQTVGNPTPGAANRP